MSFVGSTRLLLADRYRLEGRIGSGRTATVWWAWDEVLGRPVAVKVLSVSLLPDLALRTRLRDETQAVVGMSHPGIVTILDFGEASVPGGRSTPYIVMEFLDGESLASRLTRGPLPWEEASRVCREVASALAFAHAEGLIHHNLRPANVFLTAAGAKVLGFGTGKAMYDPADFSALSLFEPARLPETSPYAAPEQLGEGAVTSAADVFALGTILAEALVGRLARDVPLPSGVPEELAFLCVRCLATDPASRPSAAEVAELLAAPIRPSATQVTEFLTLPFGPSAREVPALGDELRETARTAGADPADALSEQLLDEAERRRRCRQFAIDAAAAAVVVLVLLSLLKDARHANPPSPAMTARAAAAPAPPAGTRAPSTSGPLPRTPQQTWTVTRAPSTAEPAGPSIQVNLVDSLTRLRRSVSAGVAEGEIRSDVGVDLNNLVTNLQR
jgi:hypothetical protein